MLLARRFTLDRVLADVARSTPGLDLYYGVAVDGLVLDRESAESPRVRGVRLSNREVLATDLVVDASGRRTQIPALLAAQGIELPLEAWDCGLVYFTRHYRVRSGAPRRC
jgi:hypothetical protein